MIYMIHGLYCMYMYVMYIYNAYSLIANRIFVFSFQVQLESVSLVEARWMRGTQVLQGVKLSLSPQFWGSPPFSLPFLEFGVQFGITTGNKYIFTCQIQSLVSEVNVKLYGARPLTIALESDREYQVRCRQVYRYKVQIQIHIAKLRSKMTKKTSKRKGYNAKGCKHQEENKGVCVCIEQVRI